MGSSTKPNQLRTQRPSRFGKCRPNRCRGALFKPSVGLSGIAMQALKVLRVNGVVHKTQPIENTAPFPFREMSPEQMSGCPIQAICWLEWDSDASLEGTSSEWGRPQNPTN